MRSEKGLVVGHLVIDYVVRHGITRKALGGSAAYCSFALIRYGVIPVIVSKVGQDFPNEYLLFLARNGIDISYVKLTKGRSTSFKLEYFDDERRLYILGICEPIFPKDLPSNLNEYIFIHLGSVAREIPLETVEYIANNYKGIVSLDLQGYVRKFVGNNVLYEYNEEAVNVLKYVDIVHADDREASIICKSKEPWNMCLEISNYGPNIVIVSLGRKGAYLSIDNEVYYIPIAKPRVIIDETGAGDVYTAIFVAHYAITKDVFEAISLAASAVSFLVEDKGISGLVTKEKMFERIKEVLDNIKRVK